MKVRSGRRIHLEDYSFEDFKLVEFSLELEIWTPDTQHSCNQCAEVENDLAAQDSPLSFLVKFKADHLSDPKKLRKQGIMGYLLPEGPSYDYRKEPGAPSGFRSVTDNHFNLHLLPRNAEKLAYDVFKHTEKHLAYLPHEVETYLAGRFQTPEWRALLKRPDKKNWNKAVRAILRKNFERDFGAIDKKGLKISSELDDEGLRRSLLLLHAFAALLPAEVQTIQNELGESYLS